MKTSDNAQIYIRLVGSDRNNTSAIPLNDLSKTLYGIEQVLADFAHICRLNGEITLTANPPEEGSFIIGICVDLKLGYGQLPFEHVKYLLDFLKLCSDAALREAHAFFKELNNIRGSLNLYFEKHPFEIFLLALAVPNLVELAKKMKVSPLPPDDNTPKRTARELHNMIKRNGFKKLLWPIVNDSVESIEISPDKTFKNNTSCITNVHLEQLLGKDNEILPELIDGETYELQGLITSLKSTRGDSLTFHYTSYNGTHNIDLIPPVGIDTKHYRDYYKEYVVIIARVERVSLYKKPKLKLIDMKLNQLNLLDVSIINKIDNTTNEHISSL